ncbi:hypothetical protein AX16_007934 [Volvariella volvacea WC 439]|nr:hypothetical protein AX16_007934 [Volvariella volvacea WC 439]
MDTRPTSQSLEIPSGTHDSASYSSFQDTETQSGSSTRRPNRSILLQRRIYLPIVITLGQSVFFFGGWAFFLVTQAKPIPLPNKLAVAVRDNPQFVTLVITQIATLISITTSYLYSQAIRYAVAISLSQPMSLFTLSSSVKLAGQKPVFSLRHWKWTIGALVFVVALGAQTAGWTALLMPRPIEIGTPLTGFGVDLANEKLNEKIVEDTMSGALCPYKLINIGPHVLDSGITAVSAFHNQTSNLNFNEMTFKRSTGNAVTELNPSELPVNAEFASPPNMVPGFHRNYTVTQQGFTADIHCEYQELNERTTPSLVGPIVTPILSDRRDPLVATSIHGACRNGKPFASQHTTIVGENGEVGDTVFTVLCTPSNTPEFELILVGYGKYSWVKPAVCSISPKVTLVDVHYSQSTLSASIPDTIRIDPPRNSIDLPTADFAPVMLSDSLFQMQGLTGHGFGDALSIFHCPKTVDKEGKLNRVVEAFLTGVFELLGTLVRAAYTETANMHWGEEGAPIPDEFRYSINGTFATETIGWHQNMHALPGVLLAPTLVTGVSIVLVIITLIRTHRNPDRDVDGQDYFDLGNFLHIVSAASAGEFKEPFPSVKADDSEHDLHSEKIHVVLGCTMSGELGLVQQDNV